MGDSPRKFLAFATLICLCGLTYLLFINPYMTEGISTPSMSVTDSKAAELIAFWEIIGCGLLFTLLLSLSKLFRIMVVILLAAIGVNKILEWIFHND